MIRRDKSCSQSRFLRRSRSRPERICQHRGRHAPALGQGRSLGLCRRVRGIGLIGRGIWRSGCLGHLGDSDAGRRGTDAGGNERNKGQEGRDFRPPFPLFQIEWGCGSRKLPHT